MKLYLNLTPSDKGYEWARILMVIRESIEGYLHNHFELDGAELQALTGVFLGTIFEPVNQLSQSMLTFTFDNSDVKDKQINTSIEVLTLDTRIDDIMDKVREALEQRMVDIANSEQPSGILEFMESLEGDKRTELVKQLVVITHGHVTRLVDEFFRELAAEIISITVRFTPTPVVVDTGKERVMSIAAITKDVPEEE